MPDPRSLTYHHDGLGLTELCLVRVLDTPHPVNGAHHFYDLTRLLTPEERERGGVPHLNVGYIQFQRGPRTEADSTPGTLDGAVLAVLIHRYECFQWGPFACAENGKVLEHLRTALDLIKARAVDRANRGVLGTNVR